MIGRFSTLGGYRELFNLREFYLCLLGGGLALASFYLAGRNGWPGWLVLALGVAAVAINNLHTRLTQDIASVLSPQETFALGDILRRISPSF